MSDDDNFERDKRKERVFERLGTTSPRCPGCGDTDWRCLEMHHPIGRKRDPLTVNYCCNCHKILTDNGKDHPMTNFSKDPVLDRLVNLMLGLIDMLRLAADHLDELVRALIAREKRQAD
jgi:hypothetical protein